MRTTKASRLVERNVFSIDDGPFRRDRPVTVELQFVQSAQGEGSEPAELKRLKAI
jgi:hypothetical protein